MTAKPATANRQQQEPATAKTATAKTGNGKNDDKAFPSH